jgi:hypothetical protein
LQVEQYFIGELVYTMSTRCQKPARKQVSS